MVHDLSLSRTPINDFLLFLFQVNEFLTGKSPLTLAMRLGDHMMFVQLQLSTTGTHAKRGSVPPCTVTSPRPATRSMPSSPGSRSPLQPTPLYPHQHPHRLHSPRTQFPFHSPPSSPTSPPPSPTSPTSPSAGPFSRVLLPSAPSGDRSTHHVAARSTHHVAARAPTNTGRVAGKRKRSMSSSEDDLLDTDTLAQASRNLSEKLKELSSQSPPSPKRLATGSPSPSSTASQRTQVRQQVISVDTVTSHKHHSVSNHQEFHCSSNSLFRVTTTTKKTSKTCILIPLWGDWSIPPQRASNVEGAFPCHDVIVNKAKPSANFSN